MPDQEQCRMAAYSEEYLNLIIEYNGNFEMLHKTYPDACIHIVDFRYAIVYLPERTNPVLSISTYGYSKIPKCLGLMDVTNARSTGSLQLQTQPGLALTGKGVMVGIIDTGIDYTNPIFIREDGTSKIVSIWDQSIESEKTPEGFDYGTEYTREDINRALQEEDPYSIVPSRDEDGHGTMLSGIAAGNADLSNDFTGMAPSSELVVVKLKPAKSYLKQFFAVPENALAYQTDDVMIGIQYLVSIATKAKAPMAICIGIGTNSGGLGFRETLAQYLEGIGEATGFCVTLSAGNEGSGSRNHVGNINPKTGMERVELRVGVEEGFTLELWGRPPNVYSIALLSPVGEYVQRIPARISETRYYNLLLEETEIRVDNQISERSSGWQSIIITFYKPTPGIWNIEVYEESYDDSEYNLRLPIHNFISSETFFLEPSPEYTLVNPTAAVTAIAVTAYNHKNNSIYGMASRGFSTGLLTEPDLAAPGVDLIVPDLNHGYITASGTSLASSNVAGGAALILEWGIVRGNMPDINGLGVRMFLIRGVDQNTNMIYPNAIWGFGKMNLYQSFERLLRI